MSVFPSKVNFVTGDILTATDVNEIGQAINLLDGAQFAAGKNKIINGDFGISQRGTTFSSVASGTYTLDRWMSNYDGTAGTYVISQQAFTPGTAPVAGYESQYFARYAVTVAGTGGAVRAFDNRMEDVRTFAGQTVTVSFWAKADASRSVGVILYQNFGSGGSSEVYTSGTSASVTTSWVRYTTTFAVPSISGKTIGAGNFLGLRLTIPYGATATVDIWGVQLEAAQTASNFQTATGTKQGELAACQRYLPAITTTAAAEIGSGYNLSTTQPFVFIPFQVPARVAPTGITATAANYAVRNTTGSTVSLTAISFNNASVMGGALLGTVASGLVAGQGTTIQLNGTLLFTGCEL